MEAGASAPTRVSSRARNKSSRAIESEDTERLLSAARVAQKEKEASEAASESQPQESNPPKPKSGKRKVRVSKYCTCLEDRKGPMIECGECLNW